MTAKAMKQKQENRELLNSVGLKNTSQRESILEIIRSGEGHLDADQVYQRARKKQPRLSLSTVYRTLQTLKELGLIEEVHLDEAHHHYEIKASNNHHHVICLGCGKVVEFECELSEKMIEQVGKEKDFQITNAEVTMSGYCPDCRETRNNT